jgi:hypothetical protein
VSLRLLYLIFRQVLGLTRVLFRDYPSRSVLGASLMINQSFLYNAIFFAYTPVRLRRSRG